jgi:NADH dehydrogenase [ubiquinone] 1 alpha subcomplex assembly factor 7
VIRFRGGPLPVADFMSEVLTHPTLGYYMTRDVFGTAGDFVTSPEVSQIFGELCAVWGACLWDAMGRPARVQLVELGPGRGTLMADLLRGAAALPGGFAAALEVHLVEVSPALRRMQAAALGCGPAAGAIGAGATASGTRVRWHGALATVPEGPLILFAHEFFDALPVHQFQRTPRGWCERLVDSGVPEAGAAAAASEGAESDSGAAAAPAAAPPLRFVLSRGATPAARLLVPRRLAALPSDQAASQWALEARTHARMTHPHLASHRSVLHSPSHPDSLVSLSLSPPAPRPQISPRAMAAWEEVSRRVGEHGGGALAIDYGEEGPIAHSLQAIRQHAFVDLLDAVGSADLSAYVDFGALRLAAQGASNVHASADVAAQGDADDAAQSAQSALPQAAPPLPPPPRVRSYGPVTQRALLGALGIEARLNALLEHATDAQAEALIRGVMRLVGDDADDADDADDVAGGTPAKRVPGMGVRYKAMAVVHADLPPPVGFEDARQEAPQEAHTAQAVQPRGGEGSAAGGGGGGAAGKVAA